MRPRRNAPDPPRFAWVRLWAKVARSADRTMQPGVAQRWTRLRIGSTGSASPSTRSALPRTTLISLSSLTFAGPGEDRSRLARPSPQALARHRRFARWARGGARRCAYDRDRAAVEEATAAAAATASLPSAPGRCRRRAPSSYGDVLRFHVDSGPSSNGMVRRSPHDVP
jgi:hypothetical protein